MRLRIARLRLGVSSVLFVAVGLLAALLVGCSDDAGTTGTRSIETPDPTSQALETAVAGEAFTPESAGAIGRDDCPRDWRGYEQSAFSICFPPEHFVQELKVPDRPEDLFLSVRLVEGDTAAFNENALGVVAVDAYDPPEDCKFGAAYMDETATGEIAPYEAGGVSGMACTVSNELAMQFKGSLETPTGAIEFVAYASNEEQLDLAKQILETVRAK